MPDSTTPDETGGGTLDVVYVIQSAYHYLDSDNRNATDEQILEEEGWFADSAAAAARTEQLNAQNRKHYDVAMARAAREHEAKIHVATTANREAAILRANGIPRDDVEVPAPFEPMPFYRWARNRVHTSYDVVQIRRSDHDGIVSAAGLGTSDETDTTQGVVPGTA